MAISSTPGEGITIQMLYFASARTAIDKSSESILLPDSHFPASKLKEYLVRQYKGNTEMVTVLAKSAISVNEEIIYEDDGDDLKLRNGDVVAVIPPVSGG